jgi:putative Mn2+ efflux pump MntP
MDAMAAAICRGLVVPKGRCTPGQALITGAWFGGFQALMPTVGYFLGQHFCAVVSRVDHWIAFFLLGAIGLHMLREAHHADEPSISDTGASGGAFGVRTMLP